MIRCELWRDEAGLVRDWLIEGHSGYAEAGSDIVCSAVSVLAITCVNSLEALCGIRCDAKDNGNGYLRVILPTGLDEKQQHDARLLTGYLEQGLRDVSNQYPKYVRVSVKHWRETP